jgi:hypothetical protein
MYIAYRFKPKIYGFRFCESRCVSSSLTRLNIDLIFLKLQDTLFVEKRYS